MQSIYFYTIYKRVVYIEGARAQGLRAALVPLFFKYIEDAEILATTAVG